MYLELSFIPSYFELPSAPYMLPFWRVFVPASMSADKIFVDFWTQQIDQVKISVLNIDGFVKSRRCSHCERSEAISLAVTA
jgi:hypothetical protein